MGLEATWYVMFALFVVSLCGILLYTKDKSYFYYFITGSLFGFYLDLVSTTQGYYSYYSYFPSFFGIPLTVTIAEGCAISFTIFAYKEIICKLLKIS